MQRQILILTAILVFQLTFCIKSGYSQWEPDVRLTNDPGVSQTSNSGGWCIATNLNVVHSVWNDNREGNGEVFYKRSTDGGNTWGADTRLTNCLGASENSAIAVSGSFVHVVWQDNRESDWEIFYKRSTDGGNTWGADTRLTNCLGSSLSPSIAVSGSFVHVVWKDYRNHYDEIYYKRSTDGGTNWKTDTCLTPAPPIPPLVSCGAPSIAVSGSNVHLVWVRNTSDPLIFDICYQGSSDGGITWGDKRSLAGGIPFVLSPSIAVCNSVIHLVYMTSNGTSNGKICYINSPDNGNYWISSIILSNFKAKSRCPDIAVSDSIVNVVWNDWGDGNDEIYYKRSTNDGINWIAEMRLTNDPALSKLPSIAVFDSLLQILWYDNRDGNDEIYYKRNPTGNTVGIQDNSTEISSAYGLAQNYPNPFNATTKIKFDIPAKDQLIGVNDNVMLKVYNIYGSEVATVVNEVLPPGKYELPFDASLLPGGIYFYQLQTKDFVATKQMILVK